MIIFMQKGQMKIIEKKSFVEKADKMMADEPLRFPTPVDTLFVEDIIYILCKPDFYNDYFSPYLRVMYPEGNNELRTFLNLSYSHKK